MSNKEVDEIFQKYKIIAIVGLSGNKEKPSYDVAEYLKSHDFRIIPVNPFVDEVLGEKSYRSLLEIPEEIQKTIEIVDIFRRPEEVLPIVEQAIELRKAFGKPFVVWMQLGIVNESAAELACNAGLIVVMDRCFMVEHKRFNRVS